MKNSEQPINPISEQEKDRLDVYPEISFKGLTKREYFAGLAMQGILANPNFNAEDSYAANEAIVQADELLEQLEKK